MCQYEELKEGIWMIRSISDGLHRKYMSDKIEELPNVMLKASLEPYRSKLYDNITLVLLDHDTSFDELSMKTRVKDIVDAIFDSLKEK